MLDGNIDLYISLGEIYISEKDRLEIWVSHEINYLGYRHSQSSIRLFPLSSFLAVTSNDEIRWVRPNGLPTLLKRCGLDLRGLPDLMSVMARSQPTHQFENVYAWYSAAGEDCLITESEWILFYKAGALKWFRTPEGVRCDVISSTAKVKQVIVNERTILERTSIECNDYIKINNSMIFINNVNGEARRIDRDGHTIASFEYRNRLISHAVFNGESLDIEWEESPRKINRLLPWLKSSHVKRINENKFIYSVSKNLIKIEVFGVGKTETLSARLRYGTLVSLRQY